MTSTIDLKCENPYFSQIWNGEKNFEVRKNDHDYQKGQMIRLNEYNRHTDKFSGRSILIYIRNILPGGQFGIDKDHCVFGFDILNREYGVLGCDITVSLDRDTYYWLHALAFDEKKSIEETAKECLQDYRDMKCLATNECERGH